MTEEELEELVATTIWDAENFDLGYPWTTLSETGGTRDWYLSVARAVIKVMRDA